MPPSLTLILRHRLESVWGEVFTTFFTWTHWVAIPRRVSPTRFTSAAQIKRVFISLRAFGSVCVCVCGSYRRRGFFRAGWRWWAAVRSRCSSGVWTWAPRCRLPVRTYRNTADPGSASQRPLRSYAAGPWSSWGRDRHINTKVFVADLLSRNVFL